MVEICIENKIQNNTLLIFLIFIMNFHGGRDKPLLCQNYRKLYSNKLSKESTIIFSFDINGLIV